MDCAKLQYLREEKCTQSTGTDLVSKPSVPQPHTDLSTYSGSETWLPWHFASIRCIPVKMSPCIIDILGDDIKKVGLGPVRPWTEPPGKPKGQLEHLIIEAPERINKVITGHLFKLEHLRTQKCANGASGNCAATQLFDTPFALLLAALLLEVLVDIALKNASQWLQMLLAREKVSVHVLVL